MIIKIGTKWCHKKSKETIEIVHVGNDNTVFFIFSTGIRKGVFNCLPKKYFLEFFEPVTMTVKAIPETRKDMVDAFSFAIRGLKNMLHSDIAKPPQEQPKSAKIEELTERLIKQARVIKLLKEERQWRRKEIGRLKARIFELEGR